VSESLCSGSGLASLRDTVQDRLVRTIKDAKHSIYVEQQRSRSQQWNYNASTCECPSVPDTIDP
jgi:hypothetical protein